MGQIRIRIHVLTAGFTSPNGCAFLMPLILHDRALRDAGLDVHIVKSSTEALAECDVLIVDGRFYSARWAKESEAVLEELVRLRASVKHLIFVSIADSAGWDHARALPYVSLYCKSQLLRDRTAYLQPLYGHRIYSDYYHKNFGVEDEQPVYSERVKDAALLAKLTVSWNSGLADYSWLGPFRMNAYRYIPLQLLLRFLDHFQSASAKRKRDLSCRIGTKYLRRSVAFQRNRIAEILATHIETKKVSRRRYLQELQDSKLAISPFGLGEITLRDFEIFMAGALLIKPDMSGIETWPDSFRDGVTMTAHRWDLADLEDKIETMLARPKLTAEIAAEGQRVYREHLVGPTAGDMFAAHLRQIIDKCENAKN